MICCRQPGCIQRAEYHLYCQAWPAGETYDVTRVVECVIAKPLCARHAMEADPDQGVFTQESWGRLVARFQELGLPRGPDPKTTIKLFPRPGVVEVTDAGKANGAST